MPFSRIEGVDAPFKGRIQWDFSLLAESAALAALRISM